MSKKTYEEIMPSVRARANDYSIPDTPWPLPEPTGLLKVFDDTFSFILSIPFFILDSIYILIKIAYYSALPLLILYFIWCMIYLN